MAGGTYFSPTCESGGDMWCVEKRLCFDMEAANWTDVVAVGSYDEYRDEYHEFTAEDGGNPVADFADMILSYRFDNFRLVAHNGGNYDFGFLFDELVGREDVELEILSRAGSAIYVNINGPTGNTRHLQDSLALMPRSLEDLADAFTDDAKGDFPYEQIATPEEMKDADLWTDMLEYLEQDCRILSEIITGFVDEASKLLPGDGRLSPSLTIASTTMSVYRQYYMDQEIPHASDPAEAHLREAYYGGRTEVFKHSHNEPEYGQLNHYDVNSLYPYVYGTMTHPVGKEMHIDDPDIEKYADMDMGGVVHVTGTVPHDCDIPVLPVREKVGQSEKVLFPTGKLSGWYELREVMYAVEVGAFEVEDAEEAYLYPLGRPFEDYTDELYGLKSEIDGEENPGKYNVVKLLLNSFWGKFGMQRDQTKVVHADEPPEEGAAPLGNSLDAKTRSREQGLYEVSERSEANYILPQIAVSVTALARIEMHKWFMQTQDAGGEIWYCDTDSIATNAELPESEALGGMDLETTSTEAYFISPKVYAERHHDGTETIKGKGMQSDALAEQVAFDDYRAAVRDNDPGRIHVTWESVVKPTTSMKEAGDMETKERTRGVSKLDGKRNHDLEANTSEPLNLNQVREEKDRAEMKETMAKRRKDKYQKAFARQYAGEMDNGQAAEFDDKAEKDSTLYAREAKKALEQKRKMKMR